MASYGYTFQSGDGVTPTRLNDARTVSEIVNADIKSDAAIAATKLASDSITNTQIKSDAAIAGTKIAPDFGSQNAATTGNVTAAKLIPTGTSATGNGMYLPATNAVAFSTNGSERMRIDASGNVLIATSTALDVTTGSDPGFTYVSAFPELRLSSNNGSACAMRRTGTDGTIVNFFKGTSSVGNISVTTTATAYNTSSDYRLKDNPQPMVGALSRLSQVNPVTFTWKSNGEQGEGFLAHELQAVVPEAVTGEKDAVDAGGNPQYQGVDASKLVPLLVSAVQELSAKVAALEAAQ